MSRHFQGRPLFPAKARLNVRLDASVYDVSPAGDRIIVNTIGEETATPITLVVNLEMTGHFHAGAKRSAHPD